MGEVEIEVSPEIKIEIEIEDPDLDHQEDQDHLGKILGVMQRGLIWRDNVGLYSLGISV